MSDYDSLIYDILEKDCLSKLAAAKTAADVTKPKLTMAAAAELLREKTAQIRKEMPVKTASVPADKPFTGYKRLDELRKWAAAEEAKNAAMEKATHQETKTAANLLTGAWQAAKQVPKLKRAFEAGRADSQSLVNLSGTTHTPLTKGISGSAQNVALSGPFTLPGRGLSFISIGYPARTPKDVQNLIQTSLPVLDETANTINAFRQAPLKYRLNSLGIMGVHPHIKQMASRRGLDLGGGFQSLTRHVDITSDIAKRGIGEVAGTLGHEVGGHALLRQPWSMPQWRTSLGRNPGYEEFLAENNSILFLRKLEETYRKMGDTRRADAIADKANQMIAAARQYIAKHPNFSYVGRSLNNMTNLSVTNPFTKRAIPLPYTDKQIANYLGRLSFFDDIPPSKAFGTGASAPTIPVQGGTRSLPQGWTLEGVPLSPEMVPVQQQFLRNMNDLGVRRFSR